MQRKPGYPVANCSIKMPDNQPSSDGVEEEESPQRRQQLINFGHAQWGFNNWSWAVSKQDLDFVDLSCGKYTAGVAAFVSISVKTFDIHRENVGYGTALAHSKGLAIHRARKCAVTNALRETLLSFGGAVASELLELDVHKELPVPAPEPQPENNPNLVNKLPPPPQPQPQPQPPVDPLPKSGRKDEAVPLRPAGPPKNAVAAPPPVAKALPMPVNLPPAANRPPQPRAPPPAAPAPPHPHAAHPRPNSNDARGDSEEARAERKRRQRLAQEEFRLKQLQRQGQDEKQELDSISTSVDNLLMAIPTQDVDTKQSGNTEVTAKRKSPALDDNAAKRRATVLTRRPTQDP